MARQLSLLEKRPPWQLDDDTRETGRRGVAEARASLQAALAAARTDEPGHEHAANRRTAA